MNTIRTQVVSRFAALVVLTAAILGLPALWIVYGQWEARAWSQLEQARSATSALYAARQESQLHLAELTAQRPTLHRLLPTGNRESITAYLAPLLASTGLDKIAVCRESKGAFASAGTAGDRGFCDATTEGSFVALRDDSGVSLWLVAQQDVDQPGTEERAWIVVGTRLDAGFAQEMSRQTAVDHTVLVDGQVAASSLPAGQRKPAPSEGRAAPSAAPDAKWGRFSLPGSHYYYVRVPIGGSAGSPVSASGVAEIALDVSDMERDKDRLLAALAVGILAVVGAGSIMGAVLARQIDRPLEDLARAAEAMSTGDLDSPVPQDAGLREVATVAAALERARVDLTHSISALERERAWTTHLLEAVNEGIVTVDESGRIAFFSKGAEEITGFAAAEVISRHADEVLRTVEPDEPLSQVLPTSARRIKATVALKDDRLATLSISGATFDAQEEGHSETVLVCRDVSDEEAVHRMLAHFLANVAHEFKTPLSALAASIELLVDEAPTLTAAELQRLLSSLHVGIVGLQTLVENLVESASIEAGHFRVRPTRADLGGIVAESTRIMQPLLEKRGQRLVVSLPAAIPEVHVDPRRTVQVIVNLLSNASKYGPDNKPIVVTALVEDSWVRISVADHGPGVGPGQHEDIFRRFVRFGSETGHSQYGAGLGLSVVKAVVEAHGGRVGVEDRPGGGSVFWVTLPAEKAQ